MSGIPMVGDGYEAEVKVNDQHLRLFAEVYELGHVAVVYNVNAKREIARRDADDLKYGMKKAEELASDYLKRRHGVAELPAVDWQMNAQTRNRQ
jgi:hypothetical protein